MMLSVDASPVYLPVSILVIVLGTRRAAGAAGASTVRPGSGCGTSEVVLQRARVPRRPCQMVEEGEVVDHARPAPVERDPVGLARLVQVKLRRRHGRQLMQQASFVLARRDCVLFTRQPIDNADTHAGLADAVAQLGREIPLDLLSRESADAVE